MLSICLTRKATRSKHPLESIVDTSTYTSATLPVGLAGHNTIMCNFVWEPATSGIIGTGMSHEGNARRVFCAEITPNGVSLDGT